MDAPVQVPVDDPNADTEWNDILRKHGVIPEKPPSPTQAIEEALVEAREQAHEKRLEGKTLDELDELEDDEDDAFLQTYRKQRLKEMSDEAKRGIYGQVYPLQKPDYSADVTEASRKAFVLVHLASSTASNIESQVVTQLFRQAATMFQDIKFCEIRADMCIEGYPERNCPTILVYRDGDIRKQIVTLKELGGQGASMTDLCRLLIDAEAIDNDDGRAARWQRGQAADQNSGEGASGDDSD